MSKNNAPDKKPRQTFIWERGRPRADLSPEEYDLAQRLKQLIRKEDTSTIQILEAG